MSIGFIIVLFLVGLCAGLFAGLIGIGGGLFYVLIYSAYLSQFQISSEEEFVRLVISNSIVSTFFASLAASIKHIRNRNFYLRPVLWIGLFGLVTSIAFTALIAYFPFYDRKVFAIVFTIAVIPLLLKMITTVKEEGQTLDEVPNWKYALTGLTSGAGTALSGLGGAFIITPILNGWFELDIKKVISISSGSIVLVAGGTSLYNLLFSNYETQLPYTYGGINLLMILPLVVGVLIAAPYGVRLSQIVSPRLIRILFLMFCIGVIIRNVFILFST